MIMGVSLRRLAVQKHFNFAEQGPSEAVKVPGFKTAEPITVVYNLL